MLTNEMKLILMCCDSMFFFSTFAEDHMKNVPSYNFVFRILSFCLFPLSRCLSRLIQENVK